MIRILILFVALTASPCLAETPQLFREKPFTAASLAEAVNHFVDLGEKAAIKELESLTADDDADPNEGLNERIGWVCRILFQPKGTEPLRGPRYGAHNLPHLSMPLKNWPLHPVASSGSTYFVLSKVYILVGKSENPKDYLKYCLANGNFLAKRIGVPTRAEALKDLEQLRKTEVWKAIKWQDDGPGSSYTLDEKEVWKFIKAQAERIPEK